MEFTISKRSIRFFIQNTGIAITWKYKEIKEWRKKWPNYKNPRAHWFALGNFGINILY